MARYDKSLEELVVYRPALDEPVDFEEFWRDTMAETRRYDLDATLVLADFGLRTLEVFDLTFSGYNGQRIKGWVLLPRGREGRLPCVVSFVGYGGGRGTPFDFLPWASAGYVHVVMDTRGQGSAWLAGDTPDPDPDGSNPQFPGFMTRGILKPETYYYRRVFADALRAVEVALELPDVDGARVAVQGGSQGGGIALAVAGLSPALLDNAVSVCLPDVPFLCHFRRATEITDAHPYQEIVRYCKVHRDKIATVFQTLGYFDGMHFARRAKADALFSVALMDDICPPSTVYAAYNWYGGAKEMRVWEYNQHEGGQTAQFLEQLRFLGGRFG